MYNSTITISIYQLVYALSVMLVTFALGYAFVYPISVKKLTHNPVFYWYLLVSFLALLTLPKTTNLEPLRYMLVFLGLYLTVMAIPLCILLILAMLGEMYQRIAGTGKVL